jgi:hypothetical protein
VCAFDLLQRNQLPVHQELAQQAVAIGRVGGRHDVSLTSLRLRLPQSCVIRSRPAPFG